MNLEEAKIELEDIKNNDCSTGRRLATVVGFMRTEFPEYFNTITEKYDQIVEWLKIILNEESNLKEAYAIADEIEKGIRKEAWDGHLDLIKRGIPNNIELIKKNRQENTKRILDLCIYLLGIIREKENKTNNQSTTSGFPEKQDPIVALKMRFAKGEISKEEFLEMKKLLEE
jgi:hypothetical protein